MIVETVDGRFDLGTFANTPIGDGLTFQPQQVIPMADLTDIRLLDRDKLESDVLEQFPYDESKYVGKNYSFEIGTAKSLEAGLAWFFKTPVGLAIITGIIFAVVIVVLGNLSW